MASFPGSGAAGLQADRAREVIASRWRDAEVVHGLPAGMPPLPKWWRPTTAWGRAVRPGLVVRRFQPADEWRAWEATMRGLMSRRYLAGYWRTTRGGFNPAFASFMDGHLAQRDRV